MNRLRNLFYIILSLMVYGHSYAKISISVNDQNGFDNISIDIKKALKSSDDDIYVSFAPGVYVYDEQHIKLSELNYPQKNLHLVGNGAVLVPKGNKYHNGDNYKGDFSIHSSWMCDERDLDVWSSVRYADGLVEVINPSTKTCRLKCKENLPSQSEVKNSYILITQWYLSFVYKIDKISDGYIYFVADNLAPKSGVMGGYNINNDFYYKHKYPRYKICNLELGEDIFRISDGKIMLPRGVKYVREGVVDRLLLISNCTLRSLEVTGFKFWGNSNYKQSPAFDIINSKFGCARFHNCTFVGFRSNLINISSSNIIIEDNVFSDCYLHGIQVANKGDSTVIRDNEFINMGKRMTNSFCVSCKGKDFKVSENTFVDFGYCGIGVGVWYNSDKPFECTGIVEKNSLFYSVGYLANVLNYGLMDSGAIYLSSKMDNVIIRNNRIEGYSGAGDNRGIFCDDGAYNYQIYENRITDIVNSYCIDSRRVSRVEKIQTPESGIERANVNIVIRDNIVDGPVRFEAHEGKNNGCFKGANYILIKKGGKSPKNNIKNITNPEEDIPLEYVGTANGKLYITSQSYRKFRKSKGWKNLRKHVEKF